MEINMPLLCNIFQVEVYLTTYIRMDTNQVLQGFLIFVRTLL